MKKKIFNLLSIAFLITGCSTQLVDKQGNIRNCNFFNVSNVISNAENTDIETCVKNAEKDGYRNLAIDYGITGLVLDGKFNAGMGAHISQIIPGSPASKTPIRLDYGYYLYKVDEEIVTSKDHANELLHVRTKESVTIVLRSFMGNDRLFTVTKYKQQ